MRQSFPPKLVARLGRATDAQVATEFGLRALQVYYLRRKLKIKPYRPKLPPFEWTDERVQFLGRQTDESIAQEFGIVSSAVAHKRKLLNIPPFFKRGRPIEWTQSEIMLLGRHSDVKVARILGIGVSVISVKRRSLHIPAKKRCTWYNWSAAMLRDLKILRPKEFGKKYAKRVSRWMVFYTRKKLGIKDPTRTRWTPKTLRIIKKLSCADAAKELNFPYSAVAAVRRKLRLSKPNH